MSVPATAWPAADPALPQRDALLDTGVVAHRIGRLIDPEHPLTLERCERLRVNYQIGRSLRVLHRAPTRPARAGRFPRARFAIHRGRRA